MTSTSSTLNPTKRVSPWILVFVIAAGACFSAIIPPLQSPDEFDHITRAYLLAHGQIVLDTPKGKSSGGDIDSGLSDYFNAYQVLPSKPERKLFAEEVASSKTIQWTGVKQFAVAPGTGYYFPGLYVPQAIGLAIGEHFALTIDTSYRLARFMVLASVAALLFVAFNTYSVSPITISLLIIPMSVFQFSSASLDGISTALATLFVATFLRLNTDRVSIATQWLFYTLVVSATLLATCRVYLLPLLLLVVGTAIYLKKREYLIASVISLLASLAWLAIAVKTTVDHRVATGASPLDIALFYLKEPLAFIRVLSSTLSDGRLAIFYRDSFFGILGWLDTYFSPRTYGALFGATALIGIFSVSIDNLRSEWRTRCAVLLCGLASILLIFFVVLVTWTPHPARLIEGVQGRHFLIPLIMISYAVSGGAKLDEGVFRKIALLSTIGLGIFTASYMPPRLIERYYLTSEQPAQASIVMRVSPALDKRHPISVLMAKGYAMIPKPLKRIGIRFGTYMRKNPGRAELRLTTTGGHALSIPFDLPDLEDNKYKYFELDSMPYFSGQIVYLTGGGVSAWETQDAEGSVVTCLILQYTNGVEHFTPGCPHS